MNILVSPGGPLRGRVAVPGDKSISHRAVMLGAIADGDTRVRGFLAAEDTEATVLAFRRMGIAVDRPASTELIIHGRGAAGLKAADGPLYLGNSGTSTRLLAGLLAGQSFDSQLQGDDSLSRRPMMRIVEPLRRMGAHIECSTDGTLPIRIYGGKPLHGISYSMPVASAQLKSALLLAGLYAQDSTCVVEPAPSRDHSERLLRHFGCPVTGGQGRICVQRGALTGADVQVPGDISTAAFLIAGATLAQGSDVLLERVGLNPTRDAVITILNSMGARIEVERHYQLGGEPAGDIRVRHAPLHGVRIPPRLVPYAIDEFPVLMVAAAFARGDTDLSGAEELRVKESDRIAALADGLRALGIEVTPRADGMTVRGSTPAGGTVDSRGDHRIAMAFAVAGVAASGPVQVLDCDNVRTSFPDFDAVLRNLGADIRQEQSG